MDNRDKEIEYLEDRIKELEKTIQNMTKDKGRGVYDRLRPPDLNVVGEGRMRNTVCSLCGTIHNVELEDGLDVYLCGNCKNNWN